MDTPLFSRKQNICARMSHPKILILGCEYLSKYFYPISKSFENSSDFFGFYSQCFYSHPDTSPL
jgi:hypothetical protein